MSSKCVWCRKIVPMVKISMFNYDGLCPDCEKIDRQRSFQCERCGEVVRGVTFSIFDQEIICLACKGQEEGHPDYKWFSQHPDRRPDDFPPLNPHHYKNPLEEAVRCPNVNMVKKLLAQVPNNFLILKNHKEAFFSTVHTRQIDMFDLMFPYADVTEGDKFYCLVVALQNKDIAFFKHILQLGVEPEHLIGSRSFKSELQRLLELGTPEFHNLLREYIPEIVVWFTSGNLML